ncbi:MAG: hypothetical protein IJM10_05880 [Clostridia bacterium]|nr:hypothetical protein [Clostridia bacterium]
MNYELVFSFLGSAAGCIAGIVASQRLTAFRLKELEKKVDKHNCLVETNNYLIRMNPPQSERVLF